MTARRAALAGALAFLLSLGVSELLAGLLPRGTSLLVAVGALVIELTPKFVEERVIEVFGFYDKLFLVVLMVGLAAAFGAGLGLLARQRPWAGPWGLAFFGALAVAASALSPAAALGPAALAALGALGAGLGALRALPPRAGRRVFLARAAGLALAAALSAATGRWLLAARGRPPRVTLPQPAAPAPPVPPSAQVEVRGVAPLVTPNRRFYRVDIALEPPAVDLRAWRLRLGGLVERPFELSYEELLDLPLVEQYVTLTCVSNEVGGDLVGNARWLGVPLADLLERAGVRAEGAFVQSRAVDGFTVGFPRALLDGRPALVAVGMNGQPLPLEHGFPARLVVSGLYGYVSATKWLESVELVTFQDYRRQPRARGLEAQGPVKTQSRIDVPAAGARLRPGPQPVAGVAWAQRRGIAAVEVQVDEDPWRPARLARALSVDTWRQWVFWWEAAPGRHTLKVRATDGRGELQTATRRRPAPDGATGHHTIQVEVE
jgi:sulfite oxidase